MKKIIQPKVTTNKEFLEIYTKIGMRTRSKGSLYIHKIVKYFYKNNCKLNNINSKQINIIIKKISIEKGITCNYIEQMIEKELRHIERHSYDRIRFLNKISIYLTQNYEFVGYRKELIYMVRGIISYKKKGEVEL